MVTSGTLALLFDTKDVGAPGVMPPPPTAPPGVVPPGTVVSGTVVSGTVVSGTVVSGTPVTALRTDRRMLRSAIAARSQ